MVYEFSGGNLTDGLHYFYAAWNSKCNVLADRITRLNLEFPNLNIYKINTTRYPNIKKEFNISKIPSYILLKNGEIVGRRDGNIDYFSLKSWLKEKN